MSEDGVDSMDQGKPGLIMCVCTGKCPGFAKMDIWDFVNQARVELPVEYGFIQETVEKVRSSKGITFEGCAKDRARKNVEVSGRAPDISHRVHDFLKEHRDLKPETVLDVGEGGRKLTELIAEQVADEIDDLSGKH